ncbi:polysaccharide biosynthesis/export family protein [Sulfurimonas sp.]
MIQKIVFTLLFTISLLNAVELSSIDETANTELNATSYQAKVKVFGYNLFNGSFSHKSQNRYNPEYLINIGDTITVKMWGAFEFETKVTVDTQGNIFLPKVGTIHVLGIKNENLSSAVQKSVKKVFKKSVYVYADLVSYQPVSVFVTGAVNKPGLYEGLSSDSIIQFLDKAKGINAQSGSYRHIKVLRHNKTIYEIDLYEFLIYGSLKLFQFHMGDVIVVSSVKNYVDIKGDVKRPYRFELLGNSVKLKTILDAVLPNPTLTNFTVTHYSQNNEQNISIYSIKDNLNMKILSGESVNFIPDHNSNSISVEVTGEHASVHNLIVKKGTSLAAVFKKIKFTPMSDSGAFQLYRKSIAKKQKALLTAQLNDLEAKTLTTGSMTTEEAIIRKQEAQLVLNFINRAKKVEPKGQVIINKDTNLSKIYLEDGDTIFIPKKSRMVIVQGEVMLPSAQTYVKGMSFDDYIQSCGGFTFRANTDKVLIIEKNGKVNTYDADSIFGKEYTIEPGDSVLVMGKVDTKYLQVVKDITQIVYQIAVGAAVVLRY